MIDLIAIHAKLGVGKDTLASFLTDHTPYSFADPLREGLLALDPWIPTDDGRRRLSDVVSTEGWDEAKKIPEVRRLMQVYGTEAGRDIHGQDCWVNIAERFVDNNQRVVIRDVRFLNEVDFVIRRGGVLVKIVGPSRRSHVTSATHHLSESGLDDRFFDVVVDNNGKLEDLKWAVGHIVSWVPSNPFRIDCSLRSITEATYG